MKAKCDPTDDAERRLLKCEKWAEGVEREETYARASEDCDICGIPLAGKRFMVDGNTQLGGCMWACMCASCFFKTGEAIGWGKGQLYTQMENGKWLMTGGFPPAK